MTKFVHDSVQFSKIPVYTHNKMIHKSNWNRTKTNWAHKSSRSNCILHYYFWHFFLCSFMIISVLLLLFSIAPTLACIYLDLFLWTDLPNIFPKVLSRRKKTVLTLFYLSLPLSLVHFPFSASFMVSRLHFIQHTQQ